LSASGSRVGAEVGPEIEGLGDPAVECVGQAGDHEEDEDLHPAFRRDHRDDHRHEGQAAMVIRFGMLP
jgi:hypothetical protein